MGEPLKPATRTLSGRQPLSYMCRQLSCRASVGLGRYSRRARWIPLLAVAKESTQEARRAGWLEGRENARAAWAHRRCARLSSSGVRCSPPPALWELPSPIAYATGGSSGAGHGSEATAPGPQLQGHSSGPQLRARCGREGGPAGAGTAPEGGGGGGGRGRRGGGAPRTLRGGGPGLSGERVECSRGRWRLPARRWPPGCVGYSLAWCLAPPLLGNACRTHASGSLRGCVVVPLPGASRMRVILLPERGLEAMTGRLACSTPSRCSCRAPQSPALSSLSLA